MTMDVSTVKAEIKAWERAFKAEHQREATVDDIRKNAAIADKYKLYKKLVKASSNDPKESGKRPSTSTDTTNPPSTPPRKSAKSSQSKDQTSLNSFFTESRKAETTAPLASFNPFSPQKNKGKQPQSPVKPIKAFSSPFKRKPETKAIDPSKQPEASTSSRTPVAAPSTISNEISRARKRLRGEPVSPSPNKGKRPRIGSQTALPFASLLGAPDGAFSDEDEDDEDFESTFFSNSPVKAPEGGKSFKLLFGEESADPGTSQSRIKSSMQGIQSKSTSRRLFGVSDVSNVAKSKEKDPFKASRIRSETAGKEPKGPNTRVDNDKSRKRSLPESDSEMAETKDGLGPVLVPPSPPPQDTTFDRGKKPEGKYSKGKKAASRKRMKKDAGDLEADEDSSSESSSETAVRIVDQQYWLSQTRKAIPGANNGNDEDDPDFDLDPIFTYSRHAAPHGRQSPVTSDHELEGTFEVDLPDKLRSVLAIQPANSKTREVREERLVKGLVMGERVDNYDPKKGGEIWNAGEDDDQLGGGNTGRVTDGEDDWEGEPIPWEVGEL